MYVPSTVSRQCVLFGSALLTEVLVGTLTLLNDTDTTAMLPDAASIAQDEQPADLFSLRVGKVGECFAERRSRIFLLSAYASCDLLLFNCLFVVVFDAFDLFG